MAAEYKKKLIEVALPLEAINAASVREKTIQQGHPASLHRWWARRPLAACRAVLFAQLVDDPSSHPDRFRTPQAVEAERLRLSKIIEELVRWESSTNEEILEKARAEIRKSCGDPLPPIYDPFSGGCSIPLEAQRLGLPAYGSDLNPVAVMIGKAAIEIPSMFKDMEPVHPGQKRRQFYRNAEGLAEDIRHYGDWMRQKAFERVGHLYPQVDLPMEHGGGKATVIAWIWARTVPSPDPAFSNVQVPLATSFLLRSKPGQEVWIEPILDRRAKTINFRIRHGGTTSEIDAAQRGTKMGRGANFVCLLSGAAITSAYVKAQANEDGLGDTLLAIVCEGKKQRLFIEPHPHHVEVARAASPQWKPDQAMNQKTTNLVSGRGYGFTHWHQLFTGRQLAALTTFSDLVRDAQEQIEMDALTAGMGRDGLPLQDCGTGAKAYSEAVSVYLGFGVSRLADSQNCFCRWMSPRTQVVNLFVSQVLPMSWDFAESNVFAKAAGDYQTGIQSMVQAIERLMPTSRGVEEWQNAKTVVYPHDVVVATDPPYYDNIAYADLSDFFFVWMKPMLQSIFPNIFEILATPKSEELVASAHRHGSQETAESFFLNGMREAISNMAGQVGTDYPATIYYAFKQAETSQDGSSSPGWSTFLQAIVDGGFTLVGTWPMRTERNTGLKVAKNVLANSVLLVCRKKATSAEYISRTEFIRELKGALPSAIADLQAANIAPADMPQSAIGPGMGVFSRYKAVLEVDDTRMSVKTALQLINQELDEFLNDLQGEFDLETRFAVTWFEQHGNAQGDYGTADNLARARGISVEDVKHAGIIESTGGKVRILRRTELDENWSPAADPQLAVWACCQHLIRTVRDEGEMAAAAQLKRIGGDRAEAVKELAYYLYDVCSNKRQDAQEASAYNDLVAVWGELTRLGVSIQVTDAQEQARLDI